MDRRNFIGLATGTLTASVFTGIAPRALAGMAPTSAGAMPMDAAAFHAARQFARTRFGNIAYLDRGRGDAVLFLHGFPLNSFQWRGAIDRLSPYRRCIAPDFMGLGYTQVAQGQSVAPDAQVEMLATLLDELAIASVDLIANDSGGQVAQLFVARHPERVRTLLLTNCDTEINSPPAAVGPVIALAKEGKWVDQWLAPWQADTALARSPKGIGGMCYIDPAHPTDEAIATYFTPLLSTPERKGLVHAYAIALEYNPLAGIASALKNCTVPVRIVWGMADTIFAPTDADHLDLAFGNSRGVRRLEESKLFWPEERPDVIAEEARKLWGAN